jgi:hypothetical protein
MQNAKKRWTTIRMQNAKNSPMGTTEPQSAPLEAQRSLLLMSLLAVMPAGMLCRWVSTGRPSPVCESAT